MKTFGVDGYRQQRRMRALRLFWCLLCRLKLLSAFRAAVKWLHALRRDADVFKIRHVVLDLNGTTSVRGQLVQGLRERVDRFVEQEIEVHILTGDIRGTARKLFADWPVTLKTLVSGHPTEEKRRYVESLGSEQVVAVGNGANDSTMLLTVVWSACVMQDEGCSSLTAKNAVLLFSKLEDALDAVLEEKILDAGSHM